MRAVALCSGFRKARQIASALHGIAGLELRLLIPNAQGLTSPRFLSRMAGEAVLSGPRAWFWISRALVHRRLIVTHRTLDDQVLLGRIRGLRPDVGLHAVGVIYRRPLIDCFRLGILNPHIGLLPEYRGRSVMEWALLNGDATGITTFFVDEGIDTGPVIVIRREIDVTAHRDVATAKRYLFSLDGEMFAEALRLLSDEDFIPLRQEVDAGKRWYVMSRLFTGVVDRLLAKCLERDTHGLAGGN